MNEERIINTIERRAGKFLRIFFNEENSSCQKRRSLGFHALTLTVLDIIHTNLKTGTECSLRDVYYQVCPLFSGITQRITDKVVKELSDETSIPRHLLRVIPASRGYAAGQLVYRGVRIGDTSDVSSAAYDDLEACLNPTSGLPYIISIPGDFDPRDISVVHAKYVLVIEKDAIFQRIVHHRYPCHSCSITSAIDILGETCFSTIWQKLDLICVTACGFPDHATRRLVHCLVHRFKLIPLGLVDYNPFGIRVLTTYRRSPLSYHEPGSQEPLFIDLRWLGLHGKDLFDMHLCEDVSAKKSLDSLPLMKPSTRENKMTNLLLSDPDVPLAWKDDIKMYMATFKAELQSLYSPLSLGASSIKENSEEIPESKTIFLLKYIESQIIGENFL